MPINAFWCAVETKLQSASRTSFFNNRLTEADRSASALAEFETDHIAHEVGSIMRSTRLRNASPVQTVDLTNDSDSDDHRSSLERHEAALPCAVKPPSRPSTRSRTFNVGERVFAYDQGVMYEARVVKTNGPMYRVHYEGYKKSQDRNLTQDFLLKLTPKNRRRFCTSRGVSFTEEAEEPKAEMGHAPAEFENS
ncbi:hypothetical protein THAOC_18871, partial [Thalassiosira oceanica]